MADVVISGNTYDAYRSLAEHEVYLEAQITATTFQGSTDDDAKGRAIITATRFLDRQEWQGSKADQYQDHEFPRTGLTYADGSEVPSDAVPIEVLDAESELAAVLMDGTDIQGVANPTAQTIQSLRAGSAAITYFRGEELITRFPLIVHELLGRWLLGAGSGLVAVATGTDGEDEFEEDRFGLVGGI